MHILTTIMFIGAMITIGIFLLTLLLNGSHIDNAFSPATIDKLTVPQDSFLRKLVIFKEPKYLHIPFLYTRVIPYLIHVFLTIVGTILLIINQFIVYFIPENVIYIVLGIYSLLLLIYHAILTMLAQTFRI